MTTSKATAQRNGWAWAVALGAAWLWTWRHLSVEWRLNEQYQFGFAIPFLAVWLAWQRLSGVPVRHGSGVNPAGPGFWLAVVAGWSCFLFGELVRAQDPTWRLAGFAMTLGATMLTAAWAWRWGGRAAVRALAMPLVFAWLALPWPSTIEGDVTIGLMRLVTGWTTGLLNLTGVAAMQHGNVIELSNGMVGVDTACSGVQSFQGSLVAAIFLGEFYALVAGRRLVLLLGAWAVAMLGNLARVYTLTRLVQREGELATEQHHDSVGLVVTVGTFAGVALLAWCLARRGAKGAESGAAVALGTWFQRTWRMGVDGLVTLILVGAVPLLARAWFAVVPGEGLLRQNQPLWLVRSDLAATEWKVKENRYTAAERNLLRYSAARAVELRHADGRQAQLFHLFWKPEASVPNRAFSHTPDVCLPSAGWQQLGEPEAVELNVQGRALPGALFRFRGEGFDGVAFHALWYGGKPEELAGRLVDLGGRGGRFAQLWTGPRRQGHEVLTVFVPAAANKTEQLKGLEEVLSGVLAEGKKAK